MLLNFCTIPCSSKFLETPFSLNGSSKEGFNEHILWNSTSPGMTGATTTTMAAWGSAETGPKVLFLLKCVFQVHLFPRRHGIKNSLLSLDDQIREKNPRHFSELLDEAIRLFWTAKFLHSKWVQINSIHFAFVNSSPIYQSDKPGSQDHPGSWNATSATISTSIHCFLERQLHRKEYKFPLVWNFCTIPERTCSPNSRRMSLTSMDGIRSN